MRMLREQAQQFDPGVTGAADNSDLDLSTCHHRTHASLIARAYCSRCRSLQMKKPPLGAA